MYYYIFVLKPESFLLKEIHTIFKKILADIPLFKEYECCFQISPEQVRDLYSVEISLKGPQEEEALINQFSRGKSQLVVCSSKNFIQPSYLYKLVVGSFQDNTGVRGYVNQKRTNKFWRDMNLCRPNPGDDNWWRYNAIHSSRNIEELAHDIKWVIKHCPKIREEIKNFYIKIFPSILKGG